MSSKGEENTNFYSGVFINYLKKLGEWNNDELSYSFGEEKRVSTLKEIESNVIIQNEFISTSWKSHHIQMLASASKLWNTEQGEAIEYGNLIHEMMSKIETREDVDEVISLYFKQGVLSFQEKEIIKEVILAIVNHDQLKEYYSQEYKIFNEREIVAVDNQIIIPDRLVFISKNEVVIIDYKTGKSNKKYHQQLLKYEQVLKSMKLIIVKKLLVYIDKEILVEEV